MRTSVLTQRMSIISRNSPSTLTNRTASVGLPNSLARGLWAGVELLACSSIVDTRMGGLLMRAWLSVKEKEGAVLKEMTDNAATIFGSWGREWMARPGYTPEELFERGSCLRDCYARK